MQTTDDMTLLSPVAAAQQTLDGLQAAWQSQRQHLEGLLNDTPLAEEVLRSETLVHEVAAAWQHLEQTQHRAHLARETLEQQVQSLGVRPLVLALTPEALPGVQRALRHLAGASEVERVERLALQADAERASVAEQVAQKAATLGNALTQVRALHELAQEAYSARARVHALEQAPQPAVQGGLGGLLGRLLFGRSQSPAPPKPDLDAARREESRAFERLQQRVLACGYAGSVTPNDLAQHATQLQEEREDLIRQAGPEPWSVARREAEIQARIQEAHAAAQAVCEREARAWNLPSSPALWHALEQCYAELAPLIRMWHTELRRAQDHQDQLERLLPGWPPAKQHPERVLELQQAVRTCDDLARQLSEQEKILAARHTSSALQNHTVQDKPPHERLPWSAPEARVFRTPVLWPFPEPHSRNPFDGRLPWLARPSEPEHIAEPHAEDVPAYSLDTLRVAARWGRRYGWRDGDHLLLAEVLEGMNWSAHQWDLEAALMVGLRPESLTAVQLLREAWDEQEALHTVWGWRQSRRLGSGWSCDDWEGYRASRPRRLTWADATQLVLDRWPHLATHHPHQLEEQTVDGMFDRLCAELSELQVAFEALPFAEKAEAESLLNYLMKEGQSIP